MMIILHDSNMCLFSLFCSIIKDSCCEASMMFMCVHMSGQTEYISGEETKIKNKNKANARVHHHHTWFIGNSDQEKK